MDLLLGRLLKEPLDDYELKHVVLMLRIMIPARIPVMARSLNEIKDEEKLAIVLEVICRSFTGSKLALLEESLEQLGADYSDALAKLREISAGIKNE